jgi:hypothetical protein
MNNSKPNIRKVLQENKKNDHSSRTGTALVHCAKNTQLSVKTTDDCHNQQHITGITKKPRNRNYRYGCISKHGASGKERTGNAPWLNHHSP